MESRGQPQTELAPSFDPQQFGIFAARERGLRRSRTLMDQMLTLPEEAAVKDCVNLPCQKDECSSTVE